MLVHRPTACPPCFTCQPASAHQHWGTLHQTVIKQMSSCCWGTCEIEVSSCLEATLITSRVGKEYTTLQAVMFIE